MDSLQSCCCCCYCCYSSLHLRGVESDLIEACLVPELSYRPVPTPPARLRFGWATMSSSANPKLITELPRPDRRCSSIGRIFSSRAGSCRSIPIISLSSPTYRLRRPYDPIAPSSPPSSPHRPISSRTWDIIGSLDCHRHAPRTPCLAPGRLIHSRKAAPLPASDQLDCLPHPSPLPFCLHTRLQTYSRDINLP